jgi:drug/metabolite transporter (DMT)-like permease
MTLVPFMLVRERRRRAGDVEGGAPKRSGPRRLYVVSGLAAGLVLFLGSSFQQIGLVYTTAGKAGFITGLYVVLVPLFGILLGSRAGVVRWLGAALAVAGLYFLSVERSFTVAAGDLWVVASAAFFAVHVLVVSYFAPRADSLRLALAQYVVVSFVSLVIGLVFETNSAAGLLQAAVPILYGGCFSVGLAYTLQILAQRHAHPAHAAIILSLEGVFAAVGGGLLIGEVLSPRALLGCGLMLAGMVTSQLAAIRRVDAPVG